MNFFKNWQKISVENATLDFYKILQNDIEYIGFDSRKSIPPEPMVNAILALNLVKNKNTKIVMVNHKFPAGLIPKIEANFDIECENLQNDEVKLIFSLKDGVELVKFDHTKTCHG